MAAFCLFRLFFQFEIAIGWTGTDPFYTILLHFLPFSLVLSDSLSFFPFLHASLFSLLLFLSLSVSQSLSFRLPPSFSLFFSFCLRSEGDLEFLDGKPEGGLSSFSCLNSPISRQQHGKYKVKLRRTPILRPQTSAFSQFTTEKKHIHRQRSKLQLKHRNINTYKRQVERKNNRHSSKTNIKTTLDRS